MSRLDNEEMALVIHEESFNQCGDEEPMIRECISRVCGRKTISGKVITWVRCPPRLTSYQLVKIHCAVLTHQPTNPYRLRCVITKEVNNIAGYSYIPSSDDAMNQPWDCPRRVMIVLHETEPQKLCSYCGLRECVAICLLSNQMQTVLREYRNSGEGYAPDNERSHLRRCYFWQVGESASKDGVEKIAPKCVDICIDALVTGSI